MPNVIVGTRRMTKYVGPFFTVLVISLITTMVAIGYFSVLNTTREVLKLDEEVADQKPATTAVPTLPPKPGTNLSDLSSDLYARSLRILNSPNRTIGPWILYNDTEDLVICSPEPSAVRPSLVLLATIPYSPLKEFIFNNTIANWARLKPHVLPVMYIAKRDTLEKSGSLVHRACSLGWVVAVAPTFIQSGFPMLRHLFAYTSRRWKAQWYGFSNGDILFTDKLVTTLNAVSTDPCLQRVEFLTSQRHNAIIPSEKTLTTFEEVELLAKQSELAYPNAIDLFIYKNTSILLYDMPDFVAGRRGFDNWLLYHVLDMGVPVLDITEVTPVVHQGIEGLTFWANSHQAIQEDDSFNIGLATGEWWYERGHLWCVPFIMQHANGDAGQADATSTESRLSQALFLAEMFDTNVYAFLRYFFTDRDLRGISHHVTDKLKDALGGKQYYAFKKNNAGGSASSNYMLVKRADIPSNCWGYQNIQLSKGPKIGLSKVLCLVLLLVNIGGVFRI